MSQSKTHNYFYKTTNLINEKYYYGIHSTDNLEDGYLGSGSAIKRAIKKYGKENFVNTIIADYPTRTEASDHERMVVTFDLIQLEECYNCKTGGDNEYTFIYPENSKKLMSIRMSGVNNPFYGKKHSDETRKKISGEKNSMFGKTHSDEAKKKIAEAQIGEKNHNFGKNLAESTKEKLRNQPYCKPCSIAGVSYLSIKDAARRLELPENTVRNSLNSKTIRFCEWQYC